MRQDSGTTEPTWLDSGDFPPADITLSAECDVCVIGGGIAGISIGWHLLKEGRHVVILEKGLLAGGETCRTTAHLSSVIDDRYTEMERIHGRRGAALAYQSHNAAIHRIEEIVTELGIACDFQRIDGYLIPADNFDEDDMRQEYEASVRAGFTDAEYPARPPLTSLTPRPCIRYPRQAQFDPIKYLTALTRAFQDGGGQVFTNAPVQDVREDDDRVQITLADGRQLIARHVVVATNSPIIGQTEHVRQAPYRTYAIAVDVPPDTIPVALYWDTIDPHHYVRLKRGKAATGDVDLLIVGGEDHKAGLDQNNEESFDRLLAWTREKFPAAGEIRQRWSGQVQEPVDGVAFIGKAVGRKNVYIATGDSGMGMTHSTIAAILITDLIAGRDNPWAELYKPNRVSLRSLPTFIKENLTAVQQLGAHITPGEVHSRDELKPGEAAIVRHGLKKVATYRDPQGNFHERSATCTHMGCVVEWNPVEKSWDCPCHGSRFTPSGEVLNGPAKTPLGEAGSD